MPDADPVLENAVAALAVDYWKLLRAFEALVPQAGPERAARLSAQARFAAGRLTSHLEAAGLVLASFEGVEITPEIPVVAINADELADSGPAFVADTLEPAVLAGQRVIAMARVVGRTGEA